LEEKEKPGLESEDLTLFNLKKEYLKMNRLTQKLVFHLINMKKSDQKFGNFLIGILFGDKKKKVYETKGLSEMYLEKKEQLLLIVNEHLKAAEELSKQEAISKNNISNSQNDESVNKRLGSYLYPPERAKKFETILVKEKNKTQNIPRNEERGDLEGNMGIMRIPDEVNQLDFNGQGMWERPTLCEDRPNGMEDYVNFDDLPQKYFYHWEFLKKKVDFYQERLKKFYNTLNQLAVHRIENERENFRPVNRNERGYYPREEAPMRYPMGRMNLRKRGDEELEYMENQERNQIRNKNHNYDLYYQE
jgi:hypothetical protein